MQKLQQADNETKRLALEALDVKVYTSYDSIEIQGIIPVDLVIIEQTSGVSSFGLSVIIGKKKMPRRHSPKKDTN